VAAETLFSDSSPDSLLRLYADTSGRPAAGTAGAPFQRVTHSPFSVKLQLRPRDSGGVDDCHSSFGFFVFILGSSSTAIGAALTCFSRGGSRLREAHLIAGTCCRPLLLPRFVADSSVRLDTGRRVSPTSWRSVSHSRAGRPMPIHGKPSSSCARPLR